MNEASDTSGIPNAVFFMLYFIFKPQNNFPMVLLYSQKVRHFPLSISNFGFRNNIILHELVKSMFWFRITIQFFINTSTLFN